MSQARSQEEPGGARRLQEEQEDPPGPRSTQRLPFVDSLKELLVHRAPWEFIGDELGRKQLLEEGDH